MTTPEATVEIDADEFEQLRSLVLAAFRLTRDGISWRASQLGETYAAFPTLHQLLAAAATLVGPEDE